MADLPYGYWSTLRFLPGVERKHFNDKEGFDLIRRVNMFPSKSSALEIELREKYYALASANALIKWVDSFSRIVYNDIVLFSLVSFWEDSSGKSSSISSLARSVDPHWRYVEIAHPALAPTAQTLRISFLPSMDDICHIDAIGARELELVHSLSVGERGANKFTLFGEHCSTALLNFWIRKLTNPRLQAED